MRGWRTPGLMAVAAMAVGITGGIAGGRATAATAATAGERQVTVAPEALVSMARYRRVYVLSPGDQLDVQVDQLPELSRQVTIRPDGFVSMPKLGEIRLAGLSVPEANAAIATVLAARVVAPEVTVIVQNPREDVAFVTGEVGRPMPVPLRQAHTVAEALAVAGGAGRDAAISKVAVIRLDETGHLRAIMVSRHARGGRTGAYLTMQAMPLMSGDLIVVPETGLSAFSRFIQQAINAPLTGVNQLFTPYLQYRLIEQL